MKCIECDMEFTSTERLERHCNTHEKRKLKGKKQKSSSMPDFDKPDFSQVM